METLPHLKNELKHEYETTKKFLKAFPKDKADFAPHEKSMKMMPLAVHIAEILGWADFMLKTDKLDFAAGDYKPTEVKTKEDLLKIADEGYKKSVEALENTDEQTLEGRWTMNMGEKLLADFNKYEAIRHALNQLTHHRAQLGVYYRLNDIPLPGSYGPSADSQDF